VQKRPAAAAVAIAIALASCIHSPDIVIPTEFRTLSQSVRPAGYYRQPDLGDHLGNARQVAIGAARTALGRAGLTAVTPCTVTGYGDLTTGGPVVRVTVSVTQPPSGRPTGTVTIRQNASPSFLQSSRITSVICRGPNTSISGFLQGGGTFTLRGTVYSPGMPHDVAVYTPHLAAGGPMTHGRLTIQI
jgi:hypothetical protein